MLNSASDMQRSPNANCQNIWNRFNSFQSIQPSPLDTSLKSTKLTWNSERDTQVSWLNRGSSIEGTSGDPPHSQTRSLVGSVAQPYGSLSSQDPECDIHALLHLRPTMDLQYSLQVQ